MYPLYGIEMLPSPKDATHLLSNSPSGWILNPISVQNLSVRAEIWDPLSSSAVVSNSSTTTIAPLAQPGTHSKGSGLQYPDSIMSLLVLTNIPCSPPLGCESRGESSH